MTRRDSATVRLEPLPQSKCNLLMCKAPLQVRTLWGAMNCCSGSTARLTCSSARSSRWGTCIYALHLGILDLHAWPHYACSTLCVVGMQTASGAVACQLLDALHPGSVQLSRVSPAVGPSEAADHRGNQQSLIGQRGEGHSIAFVGAARGPAKACAGADSVLCSTHGRAKLQHKRNQSAADCAAVSWGAKLFPWDLYLRTREPVNAVQ